MWGNNKHYFNLMTIWLLQLWGSKCNFNLISGVNTGENHGWHLNSMTLLMIFWVFEAFEAFHMSFKSSYSSNQASSTRKHIIKIEFETSTSSSLFKSRTRLINRTLSSHLTTNWHRKNFTTYQINFVIFGSKRDAAKSHENMLLPSSCIFLQKS